MLFVSLLTQCVARLGVMGWFELNKDYIAKTLCINRDKPAMKCCGKCYLQKQLKKVDDTDASKKQSDRAGKAEVLVYILPAAIPHNLLSAPAIAAIQHPANQHLYDSRFPTSIFHPPASFA